MDRENVQSGRPTKVSKADPSSVRADPSFRVRINGQETPLFARPPVSFKEYRPRRTAPAGSEKRLLLTCETSELWLSLDPKQEIIGLQINFFQIPLGDRTIHWNHPQERAGVHRISTLAPGTRDPATRAPFRIVNGYTHFDREQFEQDFESASSPLSRPLKNFLRSKLDNLIIGEPTKPHTI